MSEPGTWIRNTPEPARMRNHSYLQLREPYLRIRGDNVAEALTIAWGAMHVRFQLAQIGSAEGPEAHERAIEEFRQGRRFARIECSARKLHEEVLLGAFSHNTAQKAMKALIADGLFGVSAPRSGSHRPSAYWLIVPELERQLDKHGYSDPAARPQSAIPSGVPELVRPVPDLEPPAPELGGGVPDLGGAGPIPGTREGMDLGRAPASSVTRIDGGSNPSSEQEGEYGTRHSLAAPAEQLPRLESLPASVAEQLGVPAQLFGVDLARLPTIDDSHEAATSAARRWAAGEVAGLLIAGGPLRGKSVLAAAALTSMLSQAAESRTRLPRVSWVEPGELCEVVSRDFADAGRQAELERLSTARGLVIDDLSPLTHPQGLEALERAVRRIVSAGGPLLITTQLEPSTLTADASSLGPRLAVPILEYCHPVRLTGPLLSTRSPA